METINRETRHMINYVLWISFAAYVALVYFFMSTDSLSFMITLSSMARNLGFSSLLLYILTNVIKDGISLNTMISYAVSCFFRFLSFMLTQKYLPVDATGDWFYQFNEIQGAGLCLLIIWKLTKVQSLSIIPEKERLSASYLLIGTAVLSLIFKSSLADKFFADFCWSYGMYLEAVSMLPQLLYYLEKKEKIKSGIGNFVIGHAISLFFSFMFWLMGYSELNTSGAISGYVVIGSQGIELIIYTYFLYPYFQKYIIYSASSSSRRTKRELEEYNCILINIICARHWSYPMIYNYAS
jgi:ER lumen protein retaining receptor